MYDVIFKKHSKLMISVVRFVKYVETTAIAKIRLFNLKEILVKN